MGAQQAARRLYPLLTSIRQGPAFHCRSLSTLPSTPVHCIYTNPRRMRSAAMTLLATGQAGFWASTAYLAHQIPEPLIGPVWTYAGFGLSAAFAALVATYLRRSVAEMALIEASGPALRVTPHGIGGMLGSPVVIPATELVSGPGGDDPKQRYWTFARRAEGIKLYYIVDVKKGVQDEDAVKAVVKGGEHLLAFSHRRDAAVMKERWRQWKDANRDNTFQTPHKNS